MTLPIYTHKPNLKVLTKIFLKLSCPKGNHGGVTVLNPKYPRLSSGDTKKGKMGGKNESVLKPGIKFRSASGSLRRPHTVPDCSATKNQLSDFSGRFEA